MKDLATRKVITEPGAVAPDLSVNCGGDGKLTQASGATAPGSVFFRSNESKRRLTFWLLPFVLACFSYRVEAQVKGSEPNQAAAQAEQSAAQKYFTDVVLINQNGEKMRFYSDLLQGKVVIINSFFATCPGSCLPLSRNLEKIQAALGDRLGKDVHIISISVDATVDTPVSLKEFAKKYHAKPGWYFLTGSKPEVDLALKKLGHFVIEKADHLNIFIIGNERTGLWKKAFGLASSEELLKVVESVLNDQPTSIP